MENLVFLAVLFAALIEAYRAGDLGQVYPVARGSALLIVCGLILIRLQ
ncbi:MAG: hypothetical protein ACRECA_09800 [Pseudolabrys sp.]